MTTDNSKIREALFAELELHRVEFSTLKNEVARLDEAERQFLNLSIIAVGAGIGFTQVVGGQQIQIILLLAPLVFHVFFREMLDCRRKIGDISRYLIESLIPRVNVILDVLNKDKVKPKALWFEYYSATEPLNLLFSQCDIGYLCRQSLHFCWFIGQMRQRITILYRLFIPY